jgi:hypothetical protein
MHRRSASAASAERRQADKPAENDVSRRHALISIGKYAAYITPAMTVLVRGNAALAGHQCSNPGNPDVPAHSCI